MKRCVSRFVKRTDHISKLLYFYLNNSPYVDNENTLA